MDCCECAFSAAFRRLAARNLANRAHFVSAWRLLTASGMNPKTKELQDRTHRFFTQVIALCDALPPTTAARTISEQLIDSAGSTDSNYRAACRARTKKEFIAKLGVAAEEADESFGWLKALVASRIGNVDEASVLVQEAYELVAIFVKSQITAKRNPNPKRRRPQSSIDDPE
jgi:four helix bundle protein